MRKPFATYLSFLCLSIVCALTSVRGADDTRLAPADAQRVAAFAKELANDEFSVRKEAETKLREMPIAAIPALLLALGASTDAEARDRLHSILIEKVGKLAVASHGHTVTVDAHEEPLREVLQTVAPQLGLESGTFLSLLPVEKLAAPVTFQVENMQDCYALRWLFRMAGIDSLTSNMTLEHTYDLSGLPASPNLLVSTLESAKWIIARPRESLVMFKLDGDKVTVTSNAETQECFEAMVKQLHTQKKSRFLRLAFEDTAWRESVLAALRKKKISFDFVNTRLANAIVEIQRQTGIPIFIDSKFKSVSDAPVTLRVAEMPADLALEWLANVSMAAMSFKDHAICLTRADERSDHECAILDVSDLVNAPGINYSLASIADMLKTRIRPDSWDPALGTSIEERGGRLVLIQSPEVMDTCLEFLELHTRYVARIQKVEPGGKPAAQPLDPADVPVENLSQSAPAWREEVNARLSKTFTFNYAAEPLGDVLKDLAKTTGSTIILDPRVDLGKDKMLVTLQAQELKAEDALKQIVHPLGLDFDLREGAIFVSRRPNLYCNVELSLYYIRDLESVAAADDLITLLHDLLCAGDFADPATSIASQNGNLVVMASPACHQRIKNVFTTLRLHWKEKSILLATIYPEAEQSKAARPPLTAWLYRVDDIKNQTPAALAEEVSKTIEPESWGSALGTFITEYAKGLFVVQTPHRQTLLAEWLDKQRRPAK